MAYNYGDVSGDVAQCCRCVRSTTTIVTHATSSLLMINRYIHVTSCNRTSTDYYKLGPAILGWCETCIFNREGMSSSRSTVVVVVVVVVHSIYVVVHSSSGGGGTG